jgi:hypothetical protein
MTRMGRERLKAEIGQRSSFPAAWKLKAGRTRGWSQWSRGLVVRRRVIRGLLDLMPSLSVSTLALLLVGCCYDFS